MYPARAAIRWLACEESVRGILGRQIDGAENGPGQHAVADSQQLTGQRWGATISIPRRGHEDEMAPRRSKLGDRGHQVAGG